MGGDWAASALKWWEDAGVDTIVGETPREWLAPERKSAATASTGVTSNGAAAPEPQLEQLPDRLESFQAWLLGGDLPVTGLSTARVGPSGAATSGLMVMIDMPSIDDAAAGVLLSGAAGELFDRMLAAIQLSRDIIYLASLSPLRTATGTLDGATTKRLAPIARHHIGLVRPKALLLFGDACARALLGASVAQTRGKWHEADSPAGKISTLVTIRPDNLLTQPGLKKEAWRDLKMLREGLNS